MKKTIVLSLVFSLALGVITLPVMAEESETNEEVVDLATTDENLDEISDDELTEAEPSDLPEEEEDEALTQKLYGKMLLDVEGNGEVYYVDPVTGGKEYLADGTAAHRLLERRALGISEEDFAKLIQGDAKEDESICDESELGSKLQGRIVLRVGASGEAYWIYPDNCRAYYVGTFEAAYQLMKNYSLGIKKQLLARVKNNQRQKVKTAYRYAVHAYAEENDVDLKTASKELKSGVTAMRTCMKEAGFGSEDIKTQAERLLQAKACAEESDVPLINKAKKAAIKTQIKEARQARIANKKAQQNNDEDTDESDEEAIEEDDSTTDADADTEEEVSDDEDGTADESADTEDEEDATDDEDGTADESADTEDEEDATDDEETDTEEDSTNEEGDETEETDDSTTGEEVSE